MTEAPIKKTTNLDKHTTLMLAHLHRLALENEGHVRFGEFKEALMPLSVEIIGPNAISIAHYGEQNGDLMSDPEVVFIFCDEARAFFPFSITQHYAGSYIEALELPCHTGSPIDLHKVQIKRAAYARLTRFVRSWFTNLISQRPEAFQGMEDEAGASICMKVTC